MEKGQVRVLKCLFRVSQEMVAVTQLEGRLNLMLGTSHWSTVDATLSRVSTVLETTLQRKTIYINELLPYSCTQSILYTNAFKQK